MPGVTIVERGAFNGCDDLTDVECGKLEIIEDCAFGSCISLRGINIVHSVIVTP